MDRPQKQWQVSDYEQRDQDGAFATLMAGDLPIAKVYTDLDDARLMASAPRYEQVLRHIAESVERGIYDASAFGRLARETLDGAPDPLV